MQHAGRASQGGRGRGRGLSARRQGPGHLCLCHLEDRQRAERGAAQGAGGVGEEADQRDRRAGSDPVGAQFAEDAQRQDHAQDLAQDRRERAWRARRHEHARGSRGGDGSGGEQDEQGVKRCP